MSTPVGGDPQDPALAFGLHTLKSFRHAFNEQGLSFVDLSYVLHGILGHLLAMEMDRQIDQARSGGRLKGPPKEDPLGPTEFDPSDPEGDEWKAP